jgi:hypothetical protein
VRGGNIGSAVTPKNGETARDGFFIPSEARDFAPEWLERRDEDPSLRSG